MVGPNGGKLDSVKIDSFTGDGYPTYGSRRHDVATLAKHLYTSASPQIPSAEKGLHTPELMRGTRHGLKCKWTPCSVLLQDSTVC